MILIGYMEPSVIFSLFGWQLLMRVSFFIITLNYSVYFRGRRG
jgi:hypothetical protein